MTTKPHSCHFEPTRAFGLARLAAFVPTAGRAYANRRNTDYGMADRGNVSVLSPYIRHRLITEREVLDHVLRHHSLDAAEKFVQEVFWRSYFKGHLEMRPEIWRRYRHHLDQQLSAARHSSRATAYHQAIKGKTGIACFDAWVEELLETGYLHNHTRMWLASIWIFTLQLPWELGADFTYRTFVDGDAASNTLSWRWVAGLHTKGKTYLARAENIFEHSNGRFHPKGLAQEALALEEPALPAAQPLSSVAACAPAGPAIFLLTEEDLHPESLDLNNAEVRCIVGCHSAHDRSSEKVADHVISFTEGALDDGLNRARQYFGVPGEKLERLSDNGLKDLAKRFGVTRILMAYEPVGPVADRMNGIRSRLAQDGFEVMPIRRQEDSVIWPHATKGFFGLRERIPALVRELGAGTPELRQDDLFGQTPHRAAAHR